MLANENSSSEGASLADQTDMVMTAHKFLKAHPASCRIDGPKRYPGNINAMMALHKVNLNPVHAEPESSYGGGREGAGRTHEHGSERCIVAFLGENNWSRSKVHR